MNTVKIIDLILRKCTYSTCVKVGLIILAVDAIIAEAIEAFNGSTNVAITHKNEFRMRPNAVQAPIRL